MLSVVNNLEEQPAEIPAKHVSLYVSGVKKRCRKSDLHIFGLGEIPAEQVDRPALEAEALATIGREMKTVHQAYVKYMPCTITRYPDGVEMTSVALMSPEIETTWIKRAGS